VNPNVNAVDIYHVLFGRKLNKRKEPITNSIPINNREKTIARSNEKISKL